MGGERAERERGGLFWCQCGFVVGQCVSNAALSGDLQWITRVCCLDLHRVAGLPWCSGGGEELRTEFAKAQMLAYVLDQPKCRCVAEQTGATVAEEDLIAIRKAEQFREVVPERPDLEEHGGLAMRSSEILRGCSVERLHGLWANL